jgi:hypothetical protein
MNGEVAGYRDLVESLARKFVGRNGAELDDLVQEGLVNVWQTLERGIQPSAQIIEDRMRNWTKLMGSQTGRSLIEDANGNLVSYETLLPLDDFQHLSYEPVIEVDALS